MAETTRRRIAKALAERNTELLRAALTGDPAAASLPVPDTGASLYPIHLAARSAYAVGVQLLLDAGADPNTKLYLGALGAWTAAHFAADINCVDTLQTLIAAGADITSPDSDGLSPLHIAAKAGSCAALTALLEHGANPNTSDYGQLMAVHIVAAYGDTPSLLALLRWGADPLAPDPDGKTPEQLAAANAHRAVVDILRDHARGRALSREGPHRPCPGTTPHGPSL